jgi:hypothetical protein
MLWVHGNEWKETTTSILDNLPLPLDRQKELLDIAGEITLLYQNVETDLERLCSISCSACEDICCQRATVWYDLKDLLYIHLCSGKFPDGQIFRHKDGACSHLRPVGCAVARNRRPFICTWYICSAQKEKAGVAEGLNLDGLIAAIDRIKELRKQLVAIGHLEQKDM